MDQDVAKAADLAPGDVGTERLLSIRKLLGCFGQRLKIAQGSIVEDVILGNIPTRPDSANLGDRDVMAILRRIEQKMALPPV